MQPFVDSTCAKAWLQVVQHLLRLPADQKMQDYHLVIEITDPMTDTEADRLVLSEVDAFLKSVGKNPLQTVAGTIFPNDLYRNGTRSADQVYERYPNVVVPVLKRAKSWRWGTYAYRMVRRELSNGTGFVTHPKHPEMPLNPLREIVERLKRQANANGPAKHAAYELDLIDTFADIPLSNPETDREIMGGPCLSHVSFKIGPDKQLHLAAFFRLHYYIQRSLGNFIGLRNLLRFAAKESELKVGSLVCISSKADIDMTSKVWGKTEVQQLAARCQAIYVNGEKNYSRPEWTQSNKQPFIGAD